MVMAMDWPKAADYRNVAPRILPHGKAWHCHSRFESFIIVSGCPAGATYADVKFAWQVIPFWGGEAAYRAVCTLSRLAEPGRKGRSIPARTRLASDVCVPILGCTA